MRWIGLKTSEFFNRTELGEIKKSLKKINFFWDNRLWVPLWEYRKQRNKIAIFNRFNRCLDISIADFDENERLIHRTYVDRIIQPVSFINVKILDRLAYLSIIGIRRYQHILKHTFVFNTMQREIPLIDVIRFHLKQNRLKIDIRLNTESKEIPDALKPFLRSIILKTTRNYLSCIFQ